MLLYLAPAKTKRLAEVLRKLKKLVWQEEAPGVEWYLVRKDLFDLVYPLSPVSRTRKLANEILELTEEGAAQEKEVIFGLIAAALEIYRIPRKDEANHAANHAAVNA